MCIINLSFGWYRRCTFFRKRLSFAIFAIESPTAKFTVLHVYVHCVVCDPEPQIYNSVKSWAVCIGQDFAKFSSAKISMPTVIRLQTWERFVLLTVLLSAQFLVHVRRPGVVALQSKGTRHYLAIRDRHTTTGSGGKFCDLIVKEIGEQGIRIPQLGILLRR